MEEVPALERIQDDVQALRDRIRGEVILPTDELDGATNRYDDAREIWNAMIDRHPSVIVRPHGAADVRAGVRFARKHDLELTIKGGGHNVAGNAVCDGACMLDLSRMDWVRVDPERSIARVGPGALLQDLDVETQAHDLATPVGFVSTTGVAGLTLGGGIGYLSRKHGLTVDNLQSVDLVTADGEFVRASEQRNAELFWALRGGGGNFGVVTAFEFELHDLQSPIYCGPIAWALDDAPGVMREVAAVMRTAPGEVATLLVLRHAPPAPFLPEQVHGERILVAATLYAGDPTDGAAALDPIRAIGDPIADAVGPKPYTAFQSMFDAASGPGAHNYWKSHYLPDLTAGAIDVLCEHAATLTSPASAIGMLSLGGEISKREHDATAYPHRDAGWVVNVQARWDDPAEDERHVAWTRALYDVLVPHSTGGVYVNFVDADEGEARVRAAYGEAIYDRLAQVKAEWDPENVFHHNQNVEPAN